MQLALEASEGRFSSAMQYSPIGMALVTIDGRWIEVNPALCAITGYTRDELLARNFQSITYADDLTTDQEVPSNRITSPLSEMAQTLSELLPEIAERSATTPVGHALQRDPSQWIAVPAPPTAQTSAALAPHTAVRLADVGTGTAAQPRRSPPCRTVPFFPTAQRSSLAVPQTAARSAPVARPIID